jgi:hypothetical protein
MGPPPPCICCNAISSRQRILLIANGASEIDMALRILLYVSSDRLFGANFIYFSFDSFSILFFTQCLLLGGDNHLSHYYFLVTVLCLFVA